METKKLKTFFVILLMGTSLLIAYSKYAQYERALQGQLELNKSLELIKSDLGTYGVEYNSTHSQYLAQKVGREDCEMAVERVLLLRKKLVELNASEYDIEDVDDCLNETYAHMDAGRFHRALVESRVCAISAFDSIGSTLVTANRSEFMEYAREELQNLTALKEKVDREWKRKLDGGVDFTDYMITGFVVEDNIIKAEIFLNRSHGFLEELQKMPDPTTPEEIENISLLGSWIASNLEFARSFLGDAMVLMNHMTPGNFTPDELRDNVYSLGNNLSRVDITCNFTEAMLKVACDWKDYHKKQGLLGVEKGYCSAAIYHLLYAIAIDEHLDEFEALNSTFATLKTPAEKVRMILRLRHEALESINACHRDPLTSLYIQDAVGWYFKHGDVVLESMVKLRTDDPTTQPIYNYEMAKIIAKKMCPYVSRLYQTSTR
ncbi:1-deoxy-D-xylulose-5-phosphate synthase [Thermococcus sp. 21S7]|uniref:1-deoxy-D-xylulose-5-phosphate synthase n=1 Tax=Thermococcus sp. 21S7 TaxID=1638221 RepID=UPI00143B5C69|nr:1-deoxy-D-xylulose-5-phosphate synthase [Thermococcus sp. 21S7]NJE61969.1 1-deoxy-D-xylulose-5-phosphate synthase [Thermococcus sp. 21S7]